MASFIKKNVSPLKDKKYISRTFTRAMNNGKSFGGGLKL